MSELNPNSAKLGVWLIGARGAISTCVAYGLAGLVEGLTESVGLVTENEIFSKLPLARYENIVLGGHDVCQRSLTDSGAELVRTGVLPAGLVEGVAARAATFDSRIVPGLLDGPDVGFADLDPRSAKLGSAPPLEQIAQLKADFDAFRKSQNCSQVVVINVASTEAYRENEDAWETLERFEAALDEGKAQPASTIYAYAALSSGCAYINFTPSRGSSIPALRELAEKQGLPHCGSDGKTGETLLKTVLAPMFKARALRVLAWQGYNMLGNRDGEILNEASHRQGKLLNKDEALRSILNDPDMHSQVAIDYVPSLADWKTAWDFIHFEGFLGAKMSLQFTWAGSDSALASPLVLDLARLAGLSLDRGEAGVMAHVASFFKAPLSGGTHDFHAQYAILERYALGN
ncbi:MAG: myo-inositol-1-phosphate synthase [Candidatus Paceibacteria bacterium]|jgi:myo-inositol-1-phosphate synthase